MGLKQSELLEFYKKLKIGDKFIIDQNISITELIKDIISSVSLDGEVDVYYDIGKGVYIITKKDVKRFMAECSGDIDFIFAENIKDAFDMAYKKYGEKLTNLHLHRYL